MFIFKTPLCRKNKDRSKDNNNQKKTDSNQKKFKILWVKYLCEQ